MRSGCWWKRAEGMAKAAEGMWNDEVVLPVVIAAEGLCARGMAHGAKWRREQRGRRRIERIQSRPSGKPRNEGVRASGVGRRDWRTARQRVLRGWR